MKKKLFYIFFTVISMVLLIAFASVSFAEENIISGNISSSYGESCDEMVLFNVSDENVDADLDAKIVSIKWPDGTEISKGSLNINVSVDDTYRDALNRRLCVTSSGFLSAGKFTVHLEVLKRNSNVIVADGQINLSVKPVISVNSTAQNLSVCPGEVFKDKIFDGVREYANCYASYQWFEKDNESGIANAVTGNFEPSSALTYAFPETTGTTVHLFLLATTNKNGCILNGDYYEFTFTVLAHTFDDGIWVNSIEPTCTTSATKKLTCTKCGEVKNELIAPLGHSYTEKVVEPTCTENGYTLFTCSRCNDQYTANTTNSIGHQWSVATTQPTCTKDGVKISTCTVCGEIKNEPIAKLGHSYTAKVVEPTCTEKGYTLFTCSRCNDNFKKNETNATGHQWGDPVTTIKPTYTKNGVDTYTCEVCGSTKEDSIEKLPIPAVSSFKTAAYTSKSITLSWKAVSGATLYTVYRYNSLTKKFAKIGYSRTNSYSDSSLSSGTTYYYIVRVAVKNGSSYIYSPNSVTLKTSTSPDTAKAKIAAYSQTAIKFTWSKVSGATAYEIYIFKNNKWTKLATVTTASYTAKNLSKGTTYQFRVRATRTVSSVKYNAKYETVAFSTKTSTPTTPTVTSSAKKTATIKWSSVSGAAGYQIYYSTSKSGTFKKLATVSGKSYTNAKFTSGKIYYFKIRTYRTVNGVNYYSSLSSARAVKIK